MLLDPVPLVYPLPAIGRYNPLIREEKEKNGASPHTRTSQSDTCFTKTVHPSQKRSGNAPRSYLHTMKTRISKSMTYIDVPTGHEMFLAKKIPPPINKNRTKSKPHQCNKTFSPAVGFFEIYKCGLSTLRLEDKFGSPLRGLHNLSHSLGARTVDLNLLAAICAVLRQGN